MNNNIDLYAKCKALGVTEAGLKLIDKIRAGEPVRRVSSNGYNTSSRYPSKKMACTIQAESNLELAAVLDFEFRDGCVEYYDQPYRFSIPNQDGKVTTVSYTPDFFVIENGMFFFEELKPVYRMEKLVKAKPWRYQYDESTGEYISPLIEEFLKEYGIKYRIRTDISFSKIYLSNARYLLGYLHNQNEINISEKIKQKVYCAFSSNIYITFSDLLNKVSELCIDDVLLMIVKGELYCDIKNESLQKRDDCRLMKDWGLAFKVSSVISDYKKPIVEQSRSIAVDDRIMFEGNDAKYKVISRMHDQCVLLDDSGGSITLQLSELEKMKNNSLLHHSPKHSNGIKDKIMSLSEDEWKA